jgi:hypothetical protein
MLNCCAAIEGHHSHFMQYPHAEKIALFSDCHHKTTSSYFLWCENTGQVLNGA